MFESSWVTCTDLALTQANQVRFPNGLNANKKHVVSPASVGRLDANKRHLDLSYALVELCLASLPLVLGELGPVFRPAGAPTFFQNDQGGNSTV